MSSNDQGADAVVGRWLTIPRTLCFVLNGDDVLLMKRSPHRRIFPNRYNGVGGHIERDESPIEGARREIREETGLEVRDMKLCGVHHIDAGAESGIMMFVFVAYSDDRIVRADEREGTLHWVRQDEIMTLDLVEDLPHILPNVLAMSKYAPPFFVHVSYDTADEIQLRVAE